MMLNVAHLSVARPEFKISAILLACRLILQWELAVRIATLTDQPQVITAADLMVFG